MVNNKKNGQSDNSSNKIYSFGSEKKSGDYVPKRKNNGITKKSKFIQRWTPLLSDVTR
jgi:hypothetical protein